MSAVFKREFKAYMHNVYGFLFMAILLFFAGVFVSIFNMVGGSASIEYALYYIRYVLVILIPILCMRSMAEDRRNKTDLFYLSLPLSPFAIVLGKYAALLAVFAIPCGVIALLPLVLGLFGGVNFVAAYLSILFFFLIGAALIALCLFLSSLTENLVISAVLGVFASVCVCFTPVVTPILPDSPVVSFAGFVILAILAALVAFLTTRNLTVTTVVGAALIIPLSLLYVFLGEHFAGLLPAVLEYISPFHHFDDIAELGVLNLSSLVLLLSYPVLFVYLTVLSADRKRFV